MAANRNVITRNEITNTARCNTDSAAGSSEPNKEPKAAIAAFKANETNNKKPTPKINPNK